MNEPVDIHFATGNGHKVAELQALVNDSNLPIRLQAAVATLGMPPVVEDAGTFIGNAGKKARALHARLGGAAWVLADDSGLCVDALGGEPGVESAYYAGPSAGNAANLEKLVAKLRVIPVPRRVGHFVCVLFLIEPSGREHNFIGRCDGRLLVSPRGTAGFGYDPIFVPDGHHLTFAELGDVVKNGISHRARAWTKFTGWWQVHRMESTSAVPAI